MTLIPAGLILYGTIKTMRSLIVSKKIPLTNNDKNKLRKIFRTIHTLLIQNMHNKYLNYKDCGLMLYQCHKLSIWGNQQTSLGNLESIENNWLQIDIQHFISVEYSIEQRLALLRRMETYYL